ncbi:MAG: FtsX-like permease family protein [Saprospiraceae bacterium]|nr:FtsX-like permease family protein [Saprospiraceae bacterium]
MIFSQFVARRYLFSKKSTNAINLITGISVAGIAVGMAALILELAVFNGFEGLLSGLFNKFNPAIKITAEQGKFFDSDSSTREDILNIQGVESISETLEEIALFEYEGNIVFATIKGVDDHYEQVTGIASRIISGEFATRVNGSSGAVLGANIRSRLGISLQNPFESIRVYVPRDRRRTILDQPFKTAYIKPSGVFSFQQEYDNQYVFSDLEFVERLIGQQGKLSAYELKLNDDADVEDIKDQIGLIMDEGFKIQDRYEQDEAFFRLMNLEKWMFYALFVLTLVLIAFNMIGALWMIVLDKKTDITILKALGADDVTVRNIFLGEGMLISNIGIFIGSVLALVLYWYHTQYGLIAIPDGFIVDRYPMELRFSDFIIAAITMICIGLAASIIPAKRAQKISAVVRAE